MKITVTVVEHGPATFTITERVRENGLELAWPSVDAVKERAFASVLAEGRPLPAGSIDVHIDSGVRELADIPDVARRVARAL